jgi:hypothetical protein
MQACMYRAISWKRTALEVLRLLVTSSNTAAATHYPARGHRLLGCGPNGLPGSRLAYRNPLSGVVPQRYRHLTCPPTPPMHSMYRSSCQPGSSPMTSVAPLYHRHSPPNLDRPDPPPPFLFPACLLYHSPRHAAGKPVRTIGKHTSPPGWSGRCQSPRVPLGQRTRGSWRGGLSGGRWLCHRRIRTTGQSAVLSPAS